MRLIAVLVMAASCGGPTAVPVDSAPGHVSIRILAINDFHGALEGTAAAPGVAYLAAEITAHRTPNTVFVSAGDLIGGSPLESGLFHDEPTIEIMNAMKLDYDAVGNHEFDEGNAELQRMQHGGCHPIDGCGNGSSFAGASFQFLAANVADSTGNTIFPTYEIREVAGAKIAFVGMTLENTPATTAAEKISDLTFANEAATLAALVPQIHAAGAQIIVLLVHDGGSNCVTLPSSIVDLATGSDPSVVWIASGHSHQLYDCTIGGRLVTQAEQYGSHFTMVDLDVDLATQTATSVTAENIAVTATEQPDPTIAAMVDQWAQRAAPIGDRGVGMISADIDGGTAAGESAMGDVIADAMLAATAGDGAQAALMNAGGIRASLAYARATPESVDGVVRYREAFAVQPFANTVRTVTLKGTDLAAVLDDFASRASPQPLQVAGLTFAWHPAAAPGSRVTVADVVIGGSPLVANQTYRITVNSIVGDPGVAPHIASATNPVGYGIDLDVLTAYLGAHSPLAPPTLDRITQN